MFNTRAAADYAGVRPNYLEKLRIFGGGPVFAKLGHLVRYRKEDMDEWIQQSLRASTSDVQK